MLAMLLNRSTRRRESCRRDGHAWSDRCDPVACSRCGSARPSDSA